VAATTQQTTYSKPKVSRSQQPRSEPPNHHAENKHRAPSTTPSGSNLATYQPTSRTTSQSRRRIILHVTRTTTRNLPPPSLHPAPGIHLPNTPHSDPPTQTRHSQSQSTRFNTCGKRAHEQSLTRLRLPWGDRREQISQQSDQKASSIDVTPSVMCTIRHVHHPSPWTWTCALDTEEGSRGCGINNVKKEGEFVL
jgi:hypothetical protein